MASWLFNDLPDLAKCGNNHRLIGLNNNPAKTKVQRQNNEHQQIENDHQNNLAQIVGLYLKVRGVNGQSRLKVKLLESSFHFYLVVILTHLTCISIPHKLLRLLIRVIQSTFSQLVIHILIMINILFKITNMINKIIDLGN